MIKKKQIYKPNKAINPFIGIVLFLISIILLLVTGPLGFVYGLFYSLLRNGFKAMGEYLLQIAISIDQLGNVLMQHLLNLLWITKEGYKFGNRDETISSAIGRNKKLNTLTGFGKLIDSILDKLDPNHSLDSIDYYIEPSDVIIDKLAWIYIKDGKLLSTRSKGKQKYYIPGGKRELNETDAQALFREIKEELSVTIILDSLNFIGIFETQADGHKNGILVRMTCFTAHYKGTLSPSAEIEEMKWLNFSDIDKVSQVDILIFNHLRNKGLLQ